jgi:cell division septum initiation protein DivIVA
MEILTKIDQLETIISSSNRVPATRKGLVDIDRLLDMIDQMRESVPDDIQEAESLLERREVVFNQALQDARRIKASAEMDSRNRVENAEITKEANVKSEEILAEAKQRADALLQDAQRKAHAVMQDAQNFSEGRVRESNEYARQTLLGLEQQLSTMVATVRRGLDAMNTAEQAGEQREVAAVAS